jgi:hypothetical protein
LQLWNSLKINKKVNEIAQLPGIAKRLAAGVAFIETAQRANCFFKLKHW